MKRALLVIAKRPQAGQTKTRLTPPLSPQQAANLYECLLQDTLALARTLPDEVTRMVLYAPADEAFYFKRLAPDLELLAQRGPDLGARLDNALTDCLNHGFQQVIVMNSDGPTLPVAYLTEAFLLLQQADVVLGPSEDGGYYLIGLTRPQPHILREVQMSTPTVLEDTLALAEVDNLTVNLLPSWYDVDTIEDVWRLTQELYSQDRDLACYTRQFLAEMNLERDKVK